MFRVIIVLSLALLAVVSPAWAGAREDCVQVQDANRGVEGCTKVISENPRASWAYYNRGVAYGSKHEYDRAIADYSKAIELDPKYMSAYRNRGLAYKGKHEYDRAIADYSKAIELDPKYMSAYVNRGVAYHYKGEHERAIADYSKAIELDPKYADAYRDRGLSYRSKNEYARAIADYSKAIELDPKNVSAYIGRGFSYNAIGQKDRAIADYKKAIDLPARDEPEREAITQSRAYLATLERGQLSPQPAQPTTTAALPSNASLGRRVALVIGNSAYQSAARLNNPANDARAIAASFRRLGFAEVIEKYDTDLSGMTAALKNFGDRTANADWAVVYYSGHGLEMNGAAYLIPVDAKLERDTHVSDEAVALSRVLEKVESARKLRLVILDACRNNPFVTRMIRSSGGTRSVGRGLAPIEPEGGVLVAYSAKHGTTADDGSGANSPFTEAMLATLEEPGLEINFLFRKVRDQVLASTNRRQEPFLYGSLPGESLFFKFAAPR